jgi:hypothetical protein
MAVSPQAAVEAAPTRSSAGLVYYVWSTLLNGVDNTIALFPAMDSKAKVRHRPSTALTFSKQSISPKVLCDCHSRVSMLGLTMRCSYSCMILLCPNS